ncbi:D-sedoheptulose 7-phosphate isomerase [Marinifilum caeruleilacunae]|uniref:Phosphoheptose isomerase n=1 Tax=Marinifilum caeruleilacunae TaxID=2499076 RepID=A0ABX1WS26_9BACT|nr:D-sedoheptulose 7-phosphate isomerase [Marinifilum caeruleilacunae]NOU58900.1 D-sedoheptulose 7-phosphate isomerase [Marinifilum caeruleilacunae]
MIINDIKQSFLDAQAVLNEFLANDENFKAIEKAGELMADSIKNGGKIISCGNGGSMCDAMHFAEELTGRFRDNRPGMAAVAISDPSHITCVGNDYGFDYIFSRYVEGMGQKGDVFLGISTSGNSANVINAIKAAKEKGMTVVGLTGKSGGEMAEMCDVEIRVPWKAYSDRVQEIHIKVIHCLIQYIEAKTK